MTRQGSRSVGQDLQTENQVFSLRLEMYYFVPYTYHLPGVDYKYKIRGFVELNLYKLDRDDLGLIIC